MKIKRYYLAAAICLQAGLLLAQGPAGSFKIEGKLTGSIPDSIKLNYYNASGKKIQAVSATSNGHFILQGSIKGPVNASFSFPGLKKTQTASAKERDISFFIEPGKMQLTGDAGKPESLKLSGSSTQNDYEIYNNLQAPAIEKQKKLSAALRAETDVEKKKAISKEIEATVEQNYKVGYDFFVQHPNSYITAYYMSFYAALYSVDSVKTVYALFTPEQKQSAAGQSIAQLIKGMEAGAPGQMALDFKTVDVNGKALSLSDFKGKYVILDFWASWCVPCRKSHPHLIQLYNAYKDKGLEIIGIASDDNREAIWKEAIAKDGIGIWHHVLAGVDQQKAMRQEENPNDITAKYGVMALPTKLIIDPAGKIVARDIGDGAKIGQVLKSIFEQK